MLTQGEDVEAHALRQRGWSISAIARHLERDRKTVRAYVRGERGPDARRRDTPDAIEPFVPYLRARFGDDPHLWLTALYDEVIALHYPRSYPTFVRGVRAHGLLIGALVVSGVGLVGFMIFQNSTAAAYTCDSLLAAPPSETSGDGAERLGFAVPDAGREHQRDKLRYATCPPTSGEHRAGGALNRQYYGPGTVQVPTDWIHNLEHGYAIIAYAGEPGAETLAEIRKAMDAPAPTDVAVQCGLPNKVIALRFDDMAQPFAVLAWDRALLMETFDTEIATAAAEEFQDQPQAPERAC